MSLLVTYCSCCEARYAKALYSTGSYCEQCLKHLCNPGRYINSYNQGPQLLYPASPNQIQCGCCEFYCNRDEIKKIRFECGHNFTYCTSCAMRQEFCHKDGAAVTNESLSHFA